MFNKKMYALGRLKSGEMNKAEKEYDQQLRVEMQLGKIVWYKFEGIKLRLADNTFYTADFFVMCGDGVLEVREVKGYWMDDAKVKIKVAAEMYPFRFVALKKVAKKDGGGWSVEKF